MQHLEQIAVGAIHQSHAGNAFETNDEETVYVLNFSMRIENQGARAGLSQAGVDQDFCTGFQKAVRRPVFGTRKGRQNAEDTNQNYDFDPRQSETLSSVL